MNDIISAWNLSEEGLKDLERAYETYYREECVFRTGLIPRKIDSFIQHRLSDRHASEMVSKIKNRERICYVSRDSLARINAFITGSADIATDSGTITHVHVGNMSPLERKLLISKLYGELVSDFKRRGVKTVTAKAETIDNAFIDILYSLGLSEVSRTKNQIEYGTSIGSIDDGSQKHI